MAATGDAPGFDALALPRRLGFWSAVALVIGSTIGSGIFRTPALVAEQIHSVPMFALAWVLGAMVALCGALSYAELAAMMPKTGGIYVYLREAYGQLPAFLFGWSELLVLRPAAYGAIAITCADYGLRLVGFSGQASAGLGGVTLGQLSAAGLIAVVGAVNIRGVVFGAVVQNTSTVLKIGALLVLVGVGVAFVRPADVASAHTALPTAIPAFALAMVAVLWAYDGWSDVGFVAGEVTDPGRVLPRAFFLGTLVVAVLYLAANAAYLAVIPLQRMPGAELIAADVASAVWGRAGVVFVSAAVAISTFGTLTGSMMTGPRVFFAMAEDRLFFPAIARIHPRWGTPHVAISLSIVLGVVFVSLRGFAELADQFIIGIWPFYALGVAAVFVLRRRDPSRARPYRTWGYPWVPAAFLVATVYLLGAYLVTEPVRFAANVAVVALGVPVFWWWRRRGRDA